MKKNGKIRIIWHKKFTLKSEIGTFAIAELTTYVDLPKIKLPFDAKKIKMVFNKYLLIENIQF